MSTKRYIRIYTSSLVGSGFAGFSTVQGTAIGWPHAGFRALEPGQQEPVEGLDRALDAAEAVFSKTRAFPGHRFMSALVRVDGGRAIVCHSRGRCGW